MRLKDKVCVITGAGSGIGRATAVLFAREGASVAVAGLDADGATGAAQMIAGAGGRATTHVIDVASAASCRVAVDEIMGTYGQIDVLFNNAGIAAGAWSPGRPSHE